MIKVKSRTLKIIILTAFLAGTMDILAAILSTYIQHGLGPERVLKFIASGIFGDGAFTGGLSMVFAGLIFHYIIALTWTIIFFMIFPKLKIKNGNKILIGILYGIFVWLVMNLLVVPLSNTPKLGFSILRISLGVTYLVLFIGVPISFMYHKYYQDNKLFD